MNKVKVVQAIPRGWREELRGVLKFYESHDSCLDSFAVILLHR